MTEEGRGDPESGGETNSSSPGKPRGLEDYRMERSCPKWERMEENNRK